MAQPGLLPIIPRFPQYQGPSPFIPVVFLLIIFILRWALLNSLETWSSWVPDAYDWTDTLAESVSSHFLLTAFLVPVCLLLAIQAFGIPQANPARPPSPFVQALSQNVGSSILLLLVIFLLLLAVPIRSVLQSPFSFFQDTYVPVSPSAYTYADRGRGRAGVCKELGILQRRCEQWKGSARNSVCRDLAVLQKRCEKSYF